MAEDKFTPTLAKAKTEVRSVGEEAQRTGVNVEKGFKKGANVIENFAGKTGKVLGGVNLGFGLLVGAVAFAFNHIKADIDAQNEAFANYAENVKKSGDVVVGVMQDIQYQSSKAREALTEIARLQAETKAIQGASRGSADIFGRTPDTLLQQAQQENMEARVNALAQQRGLMAGFMSTPFGSQAINPEVTNALKAEIEREDQLKKETKTLLELSQAELDADKSRTAEIRKIHDANEQFRASTSMRDDERKVAIETAKEFIKLRDAHDLVGEAAGDNALKLAVLTQEIQKMSPAIQAFIQGIIDTAKGGDEERMASFARTTGHRSGGAQRQRAYEILGGKGQKPHGGDVFPQFGALLAHAKAGLLDPTYLANLPDYIKNPLMQQSGMTVNVNVQGNLTTWDDMIDEVDKSLQYKLRSKVSVGLS